MRKAIFGVANSLDNYIALRDGAVDWLRFSDDVRAFIDEFWRGIDTVVMGRKTFDVARALGGGGAYPGVRNIVVSGTLDSEDAEGVEIADDPISLLRELKAEEGKDICIMGGGELAHGLLEAGLVDEIGVNIHPILLGSGIPLFHEMTRQIDLELLECRTLEGGCVLLRYRVSNPRPTPE